MYCKVDGRLLSTVLPQRLSRCSFRGVISELLSAKAVLLGPGTLQQRPNINGHHERRMKLEGSTRSVTSMRSPVGAGEASARTITTRLSMLAMH